jgi:PAS domain S-box-containing protein
MKRRGDGGEDFNSNEAESGHTALSDLQHLRRQALDRRRARHSDASSISGKDIASLVDELEIHQAELEVQNEELRRAQAELTETRDRYSNLFEFAPVGYLIVDDRGLVRQANLAAALLCGRDRADFIGGRIEKLFASADRDSCYVLLKRAAASEEHQSVELRLVRADGGELWVGVEVLPLLHSAGQTGGFRMTLADITARKRAEEALRLLNEQLEARIAERTRELEQTVGTLRAEVEQRRAAEQALRGAGDQLGKRAAKIRTLAGDLLLVEQRERRRLAKVLHDDLQQVLVSAKFRLAALGRAGDSGVQAAAGEVQQMLDECITISRSLTSELSPPILHEGSLLPALEWLADWMASHYGLTVNLPSEERTPPLTEEVKVLLFESVRELLFNAVKHAGVNTATVDLSPTPEAMLQVTVCDEGGGVEPERIEAAGALGGGLGLFRIRERLELFDGRLEIDSAPGRGSRFTLSVPMTAAIARPGVVAADTLPAASTRGTRGLRKTKDPDPRPSG